MNINLSKFKKVECDGKSTTLQHPSGHTIKIAHKSLSPDVRKNLDEIPMHLAKGGKAKYAQMYDPNMKGSEASKPSKSSSTMPGNEAEAKDAYTEPDSMGTDIPKNILKQEMDSGHPPDVVVAAMNKEAPPFGPLGQPKFHAPPCINSSCKSYGKSHPNCRCYGGKMQQVYNPKYAKGGEVEDKNFCDANREHFEDCEYYKDGGDVETPSEKLDEAAQDVQSAAPQPAPSVDLTEQDINPNPESNSQPQQTQPKQPQLQSDTGPEQNQDQQDQTPQDQTQATPVQDFQNHKDNNLNQLMNESQAFNSDLDNGHIKPETYHDLFAKKDTLGKIGTLFGLLVGGAGSGLTGQPNMLMQMMDNEISRDLKSQETSAANRQNFLKINQQNLMNQAQVSAINTETKTKAYALTKAQMNYAALHKLVTDTQKMPPGPQRDQAMQTLAMMNQSVQNDNFNVLDRAATSAAFYKTLFGNQAGAPGEQQFQQKDQGMRALGPQGEKLAENMESKHIPGIPGQASTPLNPGDREQIGSGIEFDKRLTNFMDWSKNHSGDLNPKDMNYGKALAAQIQGAYRQATAGGVYKEGEQNFISKIITDDPTKFFNKIRVMPQLQAVKDDLGQRLDQNLKNKGFQGYPSYQTGEQTHTSKSGKPMVNKNGKWVYK